jgi:predicted MFS family arabinose efflux permease
MTGSVLRHRWFVMAIIFLARTTMAMQFQSVAPVAPLVVADLGITYAQLGLLIGLYLLPGTVLALPGGLLGQRFGNRRVALWGLALMVIGGLVTASSHSLWPASAGRILSGAGGVLLNLILAKMTAEWFAGKEISTAMGVMLTSWPFGIGLGAALFGAVGAASSWRLVQHLAAALAAGAFVLVALFGRDAPGVGATGASLRLLPNLSSREWALALTAGAAWMLFNVGFIVMVGFGPGLLQARGATLGQAGFLVSLAIWISTISVPLGGAVVDRTRRPNLAIVLSCLLTAGAFVLIPLTGPPVVWLLLSGVVVGLAPGALVSLVPGSVSPAQLAAALGLFYATFYLGMAAMQPLAGLLRDVTGSPAAPVFFAAATMGLTAVALGAFRWIERARPTIQSP